MARKDSQVDRLSAVLSQSLKRLDLHSRLDDYGVWPIWNDVVGKTIAKNAQPEKIRNGTLIVKVSSPVWMQQLQFMKEMIVEKLNQRLKNDTVKSVFFLVGRIDTTDVDMPVESTPTNDPPRQINEDFLLSIEDPEIREAFRKLLKSFARRKPK